LLTLVIARSRKKTSTFSAAGRAITQMGGLPIGVGKGVIAGGGAVAGGVVSGISTVGGGVASGISTVGGGVASGIGSVGGGVASGIGTVGGGVAQGIGSVGGFAGRHMGLTKKKENGALPSAPNNDVPSGAANFAADGVSQPSPDATPPETAGTLTVTVLSAKDLKSTHKDALPKPYVSIRCGGKTHKTEHLKGPEVEW
jgi:hypothetical protein